MPFYQFRQKTVFLPRIFRRRYYAEIFGDVEARHPLATQRDYVVHLMRRPRLLAGAHRFVVLSSYLGPVTIGQPTRRSQLYVLGVGRRERVLSTAIVFNPTPLPVAVFFRVGKSSLPRSFRKYLGVISGVLRLIRFDPIGVAVFPVLAGGPCLVSVGLLPIALPLEIRVAVALIVCTLFCRPAVNTRAVPDTSVGHMTVLARPAGVIPVQTERLGFFRAPSDHQGFIPVPVDKATLSPVTTSICAIAIAV